MRMQSRQDSLCNQTMEYQVMAIQLQNVSPVLISHVWPRSDTGLIVTGLIEATTRTYGTLVIREFAEE